MLDENSRDVEALPWIVEEASCGGTRLRERPEDNPFRGVIGVDLGDRLTIAVRVEGSKSEYSNQPKRERERSWQVTERRSCVESPQGGPA